MKKNFVRSPAWLLISQMLFTAVGPIAAGSSDLQRTYLQEAAQYSSERRRLEGMTAEVERCVALLAQPDTQGLNARLNSLLDDVQWLEQLLGLPSSRPQFVDVSLSRREDVMLPVVPEKIYPLEKVDMDAHRVDNIVGELKILRAALTAVQRYRDEIAAIIPSLQEKVRVARGLGVTIAEQASQVKTLRGRYFSEKLIGACATLEERSRFEGLVPIANDFLDMSLWRGDCGVPDLIPPVSPDTVGSLCLGLPHSPQDGQNFWQTAHWPKPVPLSTVSSVDDSFAKAAALLALLRPYFDDVCKYPALPVFDKIRDASGTDYPVVPDKIASSVEFKQNFWPICSNWMVQLAGNLPAFMALVVAIDSAYSSRKDQIIAMSVQPVSLYDVAELLLSYCMTSALGDMMLLAIPQLQARASAATSATALVKCQKDLAIATRVSRATGDVAILLGGRLTKLVSTYNECFPLEIAYPALVACRYCSDNTKKKIAEQLRRFAHLIPYGSAIVHATTTGVSPFTRHGVLDEKSPINKMVALWQFFADLLSCSPLHRFVAQKILRDGQRLGCVFPAPPTVIAAPGPGPAPQ
ncbi:MAG: hypothetical protein LBF84_02860 [Holosporales bacterium]|nr:hypothetical protein [Holosporales bacterium]